jgi:hypothetical protein
VAIPRSESTGTGWSFEVPIIIQTRPHGPQAGLAYPPRSCNSTSHLLLPVWASLPRRSRALASCGVTYRLGSPVPTERRSPRGAGGPARDQLDPTGRDAAELVITTEEGRPYFDLAEFEAEGVVLLPFRVDATSPGAPGSHPLEVLAPAPAG